MENDHEQRLAFKLESAMNQFIAKAADAVVPSGTLGAGMSFRQKNETTREYDAKREVITVVATITIEVYRTPRPT